LDKAPTALAGKRVLIVDDNESNRRILTHHTQAWGMLPQVTASGAEALEWLRQGYLFDLAILDMQMPELDGLSLAAEIRRIETERGLRVEPEETKVEDSALIPLSRSSFKLPLVMLTSWGWRDETAKAAEVGFAAFLHKPIKQAQLYHILMEIIAGQPAQASVFSPPVLPDRPLVEQLPLRILLAEDNLVNQKVATRLLDRLGYRADVVSNGLEVLQALQRQDYDVVLMDIQMPEMDGLEASRRIQQGWPLARRPRLIAMTANAMQGDRERCLEAGLDDYISKPIRLEALGQVLGQCRPISNQTETSAQASPLANPSGAAQETFPLTLDLNVLTRLQAAMGADTPDTAAEIIQIYLEDTPIRLAKLQQGLVQKKLKEFERAAHSLKSTSATLGAMRLAALCQELEAMGHSGTWAGAGEKVEQVEAEYERVRRVLTALSGLEIKD
jgi:CheY-like chemotaxis protein